MKKLLAIIAVLIFSGSIALAGDDPVLAKAGDIVFTQSDFGRLMSYSPPYLQEKLKRDPKQKEMLIRKIMHQRIISDLARKEGFDNIPEVREQLQYIVNNFLTKEYLALTIVEKVSIKESDLQEYYARHKDKFAIPEQVKARHILIKFPFGAQEKEKQKAREKMKHIIEWLNKGGKFETLAEQYSEDPNSNKKGGDMGYFPRGRMPKAFDDVAFSLKPGQISDIVETDYGYHIIQVEDHREARTKTFEEVKDSIKEQLRGELIKSRVKDFIKKIEKDTGLKVYTERFSGKAKK